MTTKSKPTRPILNVKLLRRIQKAILAEPLRINMSRWGSDTAYYEDEQLPPCKTVGCIAGWAVAVNKRGVNRLKNILGGDTIRRLALDKLGIQEGDMERTLFYTDDWPREWRLKLSEQLPRTLKYAQVVADYIDYYIEKNTKEN